MIYVNFNGLANFAEDETFERFLNFRKCVSLRGELVFLQLLQVVSRKVVKGSVAEWITCWINSSGV